MKPTRPQQSLFGQLVGRAGGLAPVLEAQLASCSTMPEEHCPECFTVQVTGDVPLLPPDTECPLSFEADIRGRTDPGDIALVLLWHEDGRITDVEISWFEDPHPALPDLHVSEPGANQC
ncbi:hypothetical protein [Arthrobacter sp. USHLN218]|uniref:hypothetical protein n=1 Tax=Arthrobacter sp. USHLN218 TaxID=3081232 RepID=UPI003017F8EF